MGKSTLKKAEDAIGSQYPNIRIWMEAMKLTAENSMVRHSFVREYVFKNFDILEFCNDFDEFLEKNRHRIDQEPFGLYEEFFKKFYAPNGKFLCGNPIEENNLPEKVCHYLSTYKFYTTIMGGPRGNRVKANLKVKRRFRLMREKNLTPKIMSGWVGKLKGAVDIFWFTKYDSIPDKFRECSDNPEAARVIRDLLGLAHYSDVGLIEIQIPKHLVDKGSKVPTICDVCGYSFFRPAKRKDGFGRAVDLDKKSLGLPEGVHEKISWDRDFPTRYVGDLPEEKKEFSDSEWKQLLDRSKKRVNRFNRGGTK